MYKKLLSATVIILSLLACSNDDVVQGEPGEIRLFTAVSPTTRAANVAADLQNIQFAENTEISVQVTDLNADENKRAVYPFATYKADGSGNLAPVPANSTLYYPASGSNVSIYAFHPAGASENFSLQIDQSETTAYVASDLMWASLASINKESTAEQRTLQFSHKMSKIIVKLVKGTGVEDAEINSATVTFGSVIYKGTFTASTGTFVNATDEDANKSVITIAVNAGTAEHAAVIVPQNVSGKSLTITMGGGTQSYTIPASTTFAAGMKYTYTVTVNKTSLSVTTLVTDWQTPDGYTDPQPNIYF